MRRRESVAVAPEVFADFLVRRQFLHAATRLEGPAGLERALEQLQGHASPAGFWESDVLPRRVRGYQPAWLDDLLATGCWLWRATSEGKEEPLVAFVPREFEGSWPAIANLAEQAGEERQVLDALTARGASFAADLARATGREPLQVRRALRALMLQGLVANDRFDPVRPGSFAMMHALEEARASRPGPGRRRAVRPRRSSTGGGEGRWALLVPSPRDQPGRSEGALLAWVSALLERYGVLTRELVELDRWAPPWSDLVALLARAELRGEIRRGFFVEGFSGVQYASEEAAESLARLGSVAPADAYVMLSAADPANLYGGGGPLDIPLLEGGTGRLSRVPGNYLVLRGGRPVLIIESQGKRLTGLASASPAELRTALARVVELAGPKRQVLRVETYNGQPAVDSPVAVRLGELGFVRDYPGLAYYGAWASQQRTEQTSETRHEW